MRPRFEHIGSMTDINDYIIQCNGVPSMTTKNKNKTLYLPEFEIVLSNLYPKPAKGDTIKAYINNTTSFPFYSGIIIKVIADYNEPVYILRVVSELNKLTKYKVNYGTLHAVFLTASNGDEYILRDNDGFPNVNVLFAIKKMFEIAGLDFKVNENLIDKVIKEVFYENIFIPRTIGNLAMDENALYALNQTTAIFWFGMLGNPERKALQISFYDFISEFCSHFKAHVMLQSSGTPGRYELILQAINPTTDYNQDKIYNKEVEESELETGGYSHNLLFRERSAYLSTVGASLTDHIIIDGEGEKEIDTINNWVYMFQKSDDFARIPGSVYGYVYPERCYEAALFLQNKIKAETYAITETNLKIDDFIALDADESEFDVATETTINIYNEFDE